LGCGLANPTRGVTMDPNGFRMFMASGRLPSGFQLGQSLQGGYFAGYISHTANSVATHALIIAPRATGASGSLYPVTNGLRWKTSRTSTAGANNLYDGKVNTDAMVAAGIASHPAAQFCVNLSIGGYSDWYLPSLYELEIAYYNLKPSTQSNSTIDTAASNNYAVPIRTSQYTSSVPQRTLATAFRTGGSEAIATSFHWASSEPTFAPGIAYIITFSNGASTSNAFKDADNYMTRAFRKIPI